MEALDNEKDLDALALELAQRIYNGEDITADDDLLRLTAQQLLKGVHQGLDTNLNAIDFSSPDFDTLAKLTENVYHFSAAKNYHELRDLSIALRDGDKIRSFEDFKRKAEEISLKYNVSWLRSEYNQALAASQSAAHWNSFYKDKDLMPYLQYQAVMDSNTREEHAALNGVIRRIDDKFWDTYMPPNGWGCRCEAIQLPGSFYSETPDKDIDFPTVPTMFRINFGKQSLAFPPSHPYFKRLPEDQQHLLKEKSRQEIRRILSNAEQYKKLKQDNNYTDVKFNWTTGGLKATHKGHISHDSDKEERFFKELTKDGKGLSSTQLEKFCQDNLFRMGHRVYLRDESQKDMDGKILPALDIELDGKAMDIRSITSANNYGRSLCVKNSQLGRIKKKTGYAGDSVCLYFHNPAMFFSNDKLINDAEWYKNYIVECGSTQRIKHIYVVINGEKKLIRHDI